MKVLIIGSGGREHAIARAVASSPQTEKIFCAPGNPGMSELGECAAIPVTNSDMLVQFAKKNRIDLTIVGPEKPLTLGIVDAFERAHLGIFGPNRKASILEGSKVFTKEFCTRHGISTAKYKIFENAAEAKKYIREKNTFPLVIKADGLADGKGVIIARDYRQSEQAIGDMMLYEKFGSSGRRIVVEDFLRGQEVSFIVVSDGENFVEFPASQDHKAAFDGDEGPNTGGMGAYAPAPVVVPDLRRQIADQVIRPALHGMKSEDRPYRGVLYAGLMISDGKLNVLEFNCRFGDPEAQVILPLLKSDFVELVHCVIKGGLDHHTPQFRDAAAAGVVLASRGYPGPVEKGFEITGLDQIREEGVFVYHAGTKKRGDHYVTNGGRVLTVTALAPDLRSAIKKAYDSVRLVHFEGAHYRKDIGMKGLKVGSAGLKSENRPI